MAECRDYSELVRALRWWVIELNTPLESIDEVAGLAPRYSAKLLAPLPLPLKRLSHSTMGPFLRTLGLKLIVAVDPPALERMRPRLTTRHPARATMLAHESRKRRKVSWLAGNPAMAKVLHDRWLLLTTPNQLSEIARRATLSRWRRAARCTVCGHKGGTLQVRGWVDNIVGHQAPPLLHVVPDEHYPTMWRVRHRDGHLSDMEAWATFCRGNVVDFTRKQARA